MIDSIKMKYPEKVLSIQKESFNAFNWEKGITIKIAREDNSFRFLFFLKGQGSLLSEEVEDAVLFSDQQCILLTGEENIYLRITKKTNVILLSFSTLPIKSLLAGLVNPVIRRKTDPLSIHPLIRNQLSFTIEVMEKGVKDMEEWIEIKKNELFFLCAILYSSKELSDLLSPLFKGHIHFRRMIKKSKPYTGSVTDMIKLTGMKRTSFEKKFKREFGTSPHQWILGQKAEQVKKSLLNPALSMNQIRQIHGFNSATHFVRFCRQQFGMPPLKARMMLYGKTGKDRQ